MEWEAVMTWWVTELECQLESAYHESQDRAAEALGARVAELLAVERATAAERGLAAVMVQLSETEAAKVRLVETEAGL